MKNNLFLFILFLFCAFQLQAAKVDTVSIYSQAMGKEIKTVIIEPEKKSVEAYSTLYLLHGYSGNYSNWILNAPHISDLADQYGILIVCPDGGFGSWYWDIAGDKDYQYETFVSKELVGYIEQNFKVNTNKNHRAITGLSMGGHGALYLALRHQDVFGAVGSTAGGVDFRPFPTKWEIKDRLGEYAHNKEKWDQNTVYEMLYLYQPKSLEIFIDCGTEDFFHTVNERLHERMKYLNIPHHYLTLPGGHNWKYWKESIKYQMVFFNDFFSKGQED